MEDPVRAGGPHQTMRGAEWLPCSREQEGLWLLEQTRDIGAANSMPVGVALTGRLDIEALRAAFEHAVARQPALRTELAVMDGRLVWRERPPSSAPPALEQVMCGDAAEASAAVTERCRGTLDPLRWPPYAATLVSRATGHHVLLLTFHHAVFDGSSTQPLLREVADLYTACTSGVPIGEPPPRYPLAGFVAEEGRAIEALAERASTYWPPTLEAVGDSLRLPTKPGSARAGRPAGSIEFEITEQLRAVLHRIAARHRTSLFVTLLAALQALQHRYAGGGDDGVATAVAMDARPRTMRGAIGMFANEAPLFSSPAGNESFRDLLEDVRDRAAALFELRRFPFTEALTRFGSGPERREAGAQLGITYVRFGDPPLSMPGLEVRMLGILPSQASRRPLMVWLFDEPGRLRGRLDFDLDMVEPQLAHGLTKHYVRLLEAVTRTPEASHARIDLLEPAECNRVLVEWNDTHVPRDDAGSVAELVEEQVRRSPDAPALEAGGRTLSYAQLDAEANRLAHHLCDLGAGSQVPVAVCLERSPQLVVALLAIMKASAAYVPLDPDYPAERLSRMLEASRAPIAVSTRQFETRLAARRGKLVLLDSFDRMLSGRPTTGPTPVGGPDALAYVLFTSGSTGTPKGVAMPHRALVNLLGWQRHAFVRSGAVRCLQFASPSFDVAFQEIFSTLVTGGTLVLPADEVRRDFERLAAFIEHAAIGRLFLPFLALNELARHLATHSRGPAEAEVITAGERLEVTPVIRATFARRRGWTLTNQYGPTESHVVTQHRLGREAESWPLLPPIGRPIDNVQVFVLDRGLRPAPVGVPGELYVGGRCLAEGYLGQPRLTAERFVSNPLGAGRLYRTGDLVRWNRDDLLEFLDRTDQQVKIRGFRVEPGEIQARLLEHPGVRDVVVVPRDDAPGGRRLVAYVVSNDARPPSAAQMRLHLAQRLPEYMVPAAFVFVPAVPLTANGKLDRRSLPAPELSAGDAYVPPRNETEELLGRIWADVLDLDRVGIHDDFFGLGGHSLLAAEVVARTRAALGRDVSLRVLFAGPTIAQMAANIERGDGIGDGPVPRATRRRLSDLLDNGAAR